MPELLHFKSTAPNKARSGFLGVGQAKHMKNKHPLLINAVMAIVFTFFAITCIFLPYIFGGWFSEISEKRYTERPKLSPAPVPYTDIGIIHTDIDGVCGGDSIDDNYTVKKPSEEIEKYYQNEMEKYCLARQGWQVTFSTMESIMPIYDDGVSVDIVTKDSRYSACVLKDEAPSLYEMFSVDIFRISSTETFVMQNHLISYLHAPPPSLVSYLFPPPPSCGE